MAIFRADEDWSTLPPVVMVNDATRQMTPQDIRDAELLNGVPGAKPVQKPAPRPTTTPKPTPTPAQKPAQTQAGGSTMQNPGAFVPSNQAVEAPVEKSPQEIFGLRSLAEGTARSTVESAMPRQQKYQTVFNWLTRRDPTVSPWTDFVLHGPRTATAYSNASDMEAARFEQEVLARQRAAMMGHSEEMTMPMVRLRQQYQSQWDKLLSEWNHGDYSGSEQTEAAFYDEASRLLEKMQQAGMDTSTLRMPSINAGGFSQGFNKNLSEPLNNLRELDSVMGQIYENSVKNPDWLNDPAATTLFDKLGERVILDLGKSKGAIADAEKVRIQVEMMTPEIRNMYDNIMMKFFDDNRGLMSLAQKYQLDLSSRKTLDDLARDLGGEKYTTSDGSRNPAFEKNVRDTFTVGTKQHANFIKGVADVFNAVERAGGNIPIELTTAFAAMKNGIDEFHQYVMQDAPVNMKLVWDLAQRSRQENITKYNDWAKKAGKSFGWKYRTTFNPDERFSEWLGQWQASPAMKNAPVYTKTITAGPSIPRGDGLSLTKRNNGRGTI